jgi:hypothetical protein
MDRQSQIQAADVIAQQISQKISNSNLPDSDKGTLGSWIARLLELTAEISAGTPPRYKCVVFLQDKKGEKYSKTMFLGFAPSKFGPLLYFSDKLAPVMDIISYNSEHDRFIIWDAVTNIWDKKEIEKFGFKKEEA